MGRPLRYRRDAKEEEKEGGRRKERGK